MQVSQDDRTCFVPTRRRGRAAELFVQPLQHQARVGLGDGQSLLILSVHSGIEPGYAIGLVSVPEAVQRSP